MWLNSGNVLIDILTSCIRMTFGCLISFIVDISRLICNFPKEMLQKQLQTKENTEELNHWLSNMATDGLLCSKNNPNAIIRNQAIEWRKKTR